MRSLTLACLIYPVCSYAKARGGDHLLYAEGSTIDLGLPLVAAIGLLVYLWRLIRTREFWVSARAFIVKVLSLVALIALVPIGTIFSSEALGDVGGIFIVVPMGAFVIWAVHKWF